MMEGVDHLDRRSNRSSNGAMLLTLLLFVVPIVVAIAYAW